MQEREVVHRFAAGELYTVNLNPDHDRRGWIVSLVTNTGIEVNLETKRGVEVRLFKTSDAAIRWCQRIGFSEITVCFK